MHRKLRITVWVLGALALTPLALPAQTPQQAATDSLRNAVGRLLARLDSLEAGQCPTGPAIVLPARVPGQQPAVDSLATAVQQLSDRIERAVASRCRPGAAAQKPDSANDDLAALRAAADAAAGKPTTPGARADTAGTQAPAGRKSQNAFNPEISATGDVRFVLRDQSPQTDNFVAREFELSFQGDLDPYSKTKLFLAFEDGEVSVEEGYIYYSGLPGHIRADIGKFRQPLGDLNRWHLHALPENEYPLVYQRFIGFEGLSGVGLSLYTALPISLLGGTHEVWLQGTTSAADSLYEGGHQPTFLFRLQNFWQLTPSTYTQLGFTATGGKNSGADLTSRLMGMDFRLTYRPPEAGTRKEITFRAEGYQLHSTDTGITTTRYGTFLDLNAKMSRRWILGGRYDWVEAPRGPDDTEWRITPSLTWWQSEFVFLRLQGEHWDSAVRGITNLLTFQVVWAVGPHKHETY